MDALYHTVADYGRQNICLCVFLLEITFTIIAVKILTNFIKKGCISKLNKSKEENNIEYFIQQLRDNEKLSKILIDITLEALNHSLHKSS